MFRFQSLKLLSLCLSVLFSVSETAKFVGVLFSLAESPSNISVCRRPANHYAFGMIYDSETVQIMHYAFLSWSLCFEKQTENMQSFSVSWMGIKRQRERDRQTNRQTDGQKERERE